MTDPFSEDELGPLTDAYALGRAAPPLRKLVQRIQAAFADVNRKLSRAAVRLDTIETAAVRITVVETVADLPANASAREWFRVRTGTQAERFAVYVGNGPAAPLTKITPAPL